MENHGSEGRNVSRETLKRIVDIHDKNLKGGVICHGKQTTRRIGIVAPK